MRPLALRIASLQYAFVRQINDAHIFLNQALPLLQEAKMEFVDSGHKKDRRYYVPAIRRTKFAKRKDFELREIYSRFLDGGLYETFFISSVSQFESFLMDALALVISDYPEKLGISVPGVAAGRQTNINVLFDSATLEEARDRVIAEHLSTVFRAAPTSYLRYVKEVVGVHTTDAAFDEYIEIKATRDLLVHNTGKINNVYLSKVGTKARGKLGDRVTVSRDYFDHSLATLKRCSGVVKRDVERIFQLGRAHNKVMKDSNG